MTQDEESSGVIDAQTCWATAGSCWTCRCTRPTPDPELVENGQLLAMYVDPRIGRTSRHHHDNDYDEDRDDDGDD